MKAAACTHVLVSHFLMQCTLSSFSVSAVKPTAAPPVAEPGAVKGLRAEHRVSLGGPLP